MPIIAGMIDSISKLDSPYITVHQERCVLVRNRNAECMRCSQVCTSGCISFDGENLVVTPELCIGCGTCSTACPTMALEPHHPEDGELYDRCIEAVRDDAEKGTKSVCIACGTLLDRAEGHYDEKSVVRVECIGRVEETLLTMLVVNGIDEITLVRGSCETCDHATGYEMVQKVLETEQSILDVWKSPAEITFTHKLPEKLQDDGTAAASAADDEQPESSSQSTDDEQSPDTENADTKSDGSDGDSEEVETLSIYERLRVREDGTLPHNLPERREKLLNALAELGAPGHVVTNTRLWGHVVIDTETCTTCTMCAVFCPTAALHRFNDGNGVFGVEHFPRNCVKCYSCAVICPQHAIEVNDEVYADALLDGTSDRYAMKPIELKRTDPHAVFDLMK